MNAIESTTISSPSEGKKEFIVQFSLNFIASFSNPNSYQLSLILELNVTGRDINNSDSNDEVTVEASTLEEIRQKVKEYFMSVRTLQSPRVIELFQKLNKTLETPNSETKQTVSGDFIVFNA